MLPAPEKLPPVGLVNIAFRHPTLSFDIEPTGKPLLLEQLHSKQGWTHSKPSYFLLMFVCTLITGIFRVLSAMDLCKEYLGIFFFGFSHTECLRLRHSFWRIMTPKYTFQYTQPRCSLVVCKGLVFFHLFILQLISGWQILQEIGWKGRNPKEIGTYCPHMWQFSLIIGDSDTNFLVFLISFPNLYCLGFLDW